MRPRLAAALTQPVPAGARPGGLRKVRGQDESVGEFVWRWGQITDDPAAVAQANPRDEGFSADGYCLSCRRTKVGDHRTMRDDMPSPAFPAEVG